MRYLELLLVFAKIGLFTFGGGYGMIPLIQQETVSRGWLDAETLYRYIGICESTPGPIAVNMATFVGSSQGGLLGSLCATLGVVTPSFVIILLIATAMSRFRENRFVRAAMSGIRPVVAGMITATGAYIAFKCVIANLGKAAALSLDARQLAVALMLGVVWLVWRKVMKKPFSAVMLILASAACGVIVYAL